MALDNLISVAGPAALTLKTIFQINRGAPLYPQDNVFIQKLDVYFNRTLKK